MKNFASILWAAALCASAGLAATDLSPVTQTLAPQAANLVTRRAPQAMPLRSLGLREAGLAASTFFPRADEIRVFAGEDRMNESPLTRLWINAGEQNRYWFWSGGRGSAEEYVIPQGAAVVVLTKASTNAIAWKNPCADRSP